MTSMTSPPFPLGWILAAALLFAGAAPASWPPPPSAEAVLLHPDLPEYLDRGWLERLDLFLEVDGLQRVRFERAVWGAVLARLEIDDSQQGARVVIRNVTGADWRKLQARAAAILAGEPWPLGAADSAELDDTDPLAQIRAWPEVPAPPARLPRELLAAGQVPWHGHWLALIEFGARLDVTAFNTFFTPMGQIGIAFGRGLSDRVAPLLGFHAGFGDMRADFETEFGEGRTNVFGFTLNTLYRQPVGERHSLYLEAGGGYHIRSLYWGGLFVDVRTGQLVRGYVVEQQHWGWNLRFGWMRGRDHPSRPRLLDIGLGVQTSPANRWVFQTDNRVFTAADRDIWVIFSVRFWDGL
ncbi:MAG: hypothetical protein RBT60_00790 [Candidatus Krumholzibacteria bacterium]|nr:hypothetical protein [Candidatus Krumholzibacteria bacterium]